MDHEGDTAAPAITVAPREVDSRLVDLNGNVVGIDTAGVGSADNIGFAISVDAARSFIGSTLNGSTPAVS